jgi:hypothetical protein
METVAHGGRREGAGRKSNGTVKRLYHVFPEQVQWIDAVAYQTHSSRSAVIRAMINAASLDAIKRELAALPK